MKQYFYTIFKNMVCLASIFIIMSLCGCERESTRDPHVLIVGVSADYPPFESLQDGVLVGFDIDLARALAEKLSKSVQFKEMDFASIIASLQCGRIDAGISGISRNAEREKVVTFSDPYYRTHFALLHPKAAPIEKLSDLDHAKIGVQLGSTMEAYLKTQQTEHHFTIHALNSNANLVQELLSGRVQAVLLEDAQARAFASVHKILHFRSLPDSDEGSFCIALPQNSPHLRKFNEALKQLNDFGFIDTLIEKWLKK